MRRAPRRRSAARATRPRPPSTRRPSGWPATAERHGPSHDETRGPAAARAARAARLDLDEPPRGRPAHVSSASGVVRRGDFAYVIGDDMLVLAVFRCRRGGRASCGSARRRAAADEAGEEAKPDLEALTVLPPIGAPYGALSASARAPAGPRPRVHVGAGPEARCAGSRGDRPRPGLRAAGASGSALKSRAPA